MHDACNQGPSPNTAGSPVLSSKGRMTGHEKEGEGEGAGQGRRNRNPVLGIYVTLWDPPHPGSPCLPLCPGMGALGGYTEQDGPD